MRPVWGTNNMEQPTLYLLLSLKDKRTYIGHTNNLERRLNEHNSGKVKSTKHRRPLILFYVERFKTVAEAKKQEKYYKSGAGRRKLKTIFRRFAAHF